MCCWCRLGVGEHEDVVDADEEGCGGVVRKGRKEKGKRERREREECV